MSNPGFPPLDITPQWGRLNDELVALVDYVPDDKMDWSPKPELFNFRGALLHIAMARHNWLANAVRDGEETPDVLGNGQSREGIKEQLRLSWERLQRFLSDPEKLAVTYDRTYDGEQRTFTGHWIAFHLLEHDIHHRADI